jgi:hypothetical protein
MGDETGMALADALKQNTVLESFTIYCGHSSKMGDETGMALADALNQNTVLESFAIHCKSSNMGVETGMALADALKQNTVLKSFTIYCGCGNMGNKTGVAMADALKQNTVLESFTIDLGFTKYGNAIADALKLNTALKSVKLELLDVALHKMKLPWLQRNQEPLMQCCTLALLARCSLNTGLHSLTEMGFRQKVFEFFLPADCVAAQVFVNMGMVADGLTKHRGAIGCLPQLVGSSTTRETNEERNNEQATEHVTATTMEGLYQGTIAVDEKNDDGNIEVALQVSETMALEREITELESADLAEALMRSKSADTPVTWLKAMGAVRFRLRRRARSPEVAAVLCKSPRLTPLRDRIMQAGCEIRPEWADGMWLLLPLTKEQFLLADLQQPCELDILMHEGDENLVRLALQDLPKELNPKLKEVQAGDASSSLGAELDEADLEFDIVVERTFLSVRSSLMEHEEALSGWHSH